MLPTLDENKLLGLYRQRYFPGILCRHIMYDFIPGRLISNNIMVAYEILYTMKNRQRGKRRCMALKLDMSNAYDQVERPYLEAIMRKMDFGVKWIKLIMSCVSSRRFCACEWCARRENLPY